MFTAKEIIDATNAAVAKAAVADTVFRNVCTDTRKMTDGALFVALKGENFNGEDFLQQAANGGATGVVVSEDCPAAAYADINAAVFVVKNTLAAYQLLAAAHRKKFAVPIIAVTGSNGKTTTKDLTAAALSSLGNILKTAANFNNEIGLPLTLLQLNDSHKAAVVEMGMRGLGQIAALMKIAAPTVGIVTNVGEVHAEILGSIDNIAKAKGEMAENLSVGGLIVLNADDSRVLAMKDKAKAGVNIVTYGIDNAADVHGGNLKTTNGKTSFTAQCFGQSFAFEIPLLGKHNVTNALAAIAVAIKCGVSPANINAGFASMTVTKMRFEQIEMNGATVINDAYNAAPASTKAAIDTVAAIAGDKVKIAVLGDMLELGELAESGHREVGARLAQKKFAALITYGELAQFIADEAEKGGVQTFRAATHAEAAAQLKKLWQKNAVILLKGSRGMKMEKILTLL